LDVVEVNLEFTSPALRGRNAKSGSWGYVIERSFVVELNMLNVVDMVVIGGDWIADCNGIVGS